VRPFSIGKVRTLKRIGLARALSKMGYCSRSQAAVLIRDGRVTRNERIVRDPESPVRMPDGRIGDRIEVDGSPIGKTPAIYLVMNKPRGVVTTASDEKGRRTVYDLLEPGLPWVGPVGRLDKASEGLLLLTNDSEWAAKITEPSRHLDKKYHVQVDGVADAGLLARITRGRTVEGDSGASRAVKDDRGKDDRGKDGRGKHLRAKEARLLRHGDKNSWLEITLDEGKNRQIRRLLEAQGVGVLRLVRVSIGPLELGDLKKGAVRRLTPEEKQAIDQALQAVALGQPPSAVRRGEAPPSLECGDEQTRTSASFAHRNSRGRPSLRGLRWVRRIP
jgi:23S rRNA pseudouridine2605 synthase